MSVHFSALVGPSYTMLSPKAEIELSINVYREAVETGQGVNNFALSKSPGLSVSGGVQTGLTVGSVRGMSELNGHVFTAIDGKFLDFDSSGIFIDYGAISNDGLPVQIAASETTLMFVSSGILYRINSGAMSIVTLSFLPIGIVFLKNYFVALSATFSEFYFSRDDGATFDPADFQSAEADANNIVAIRAINQMLCLVGNRISQWFSVGSNPNAPFDQIDSGVMRTGTNAPASVTQLGYSLLWLEETKEGQNTVIMTTGFTPNRISNNYVANKIRMLQKNGGTDDAIGMAYKLNNQEFYRLTFPKADYTLEYNKTLNEWEDTLAWDWTLGQYHRHRANCLVSAFGKILAGDYTNGQIYELSPDVFDDYGFPLRWNRRTPHLVQENKRIAISRVDLGVQTGVGLTTPMWLNNYNLDAASFATAVAALVTATTITQAQADVLAKIYALAPYDTTVGLPDEPVMTPLGFYPWGVDPKITMKYSADGGKSYSNELTRSLGRAGQNPDVYWNRLGAPNDFVMDLSGDGPCQLGITMAWIEAEALLGS